MALVKRPLIRKPRLGFSGPGRPGPPVLEAIQYREVLASLVQKTQTKFPALNGRLTNATKLALLDDVELHGDGSATVHWASDPSKHYQIAQGVCSCRDWERAPSISVSTGWRQAWSGRPRTVASVSPCSKEL